MSVSDILGIVGGFVGIVGMIVTVGNFLSGKFKKAAGDAEWRGGVNVMLSDIKTGVSGITCDVAKIKDTLGDHGERIKAVEDSAKSAHHRIDELSGRNL